ncbi:hypothetical protein GQ457_06G005060 [Hibiscus cannabinus]
MEGLQFTEDELHVMEEIKALGQESVEEEEKSVVEKLVSSRTVNGPLLIKIYFSNMFLFKFKKVEDKEYVLRRCPWTFDGELLALTSYDRLLRKAFEALGVNEDYVALKENEKVLGEDAIVETDNNMAIVPAQPMYSPTPKPKIKSAKCSLKGEIEGNNPKKPKKAKSLSAPNTDEVETCQEVVSPLKEPISVRLLHSPLKSHIDIEIELDSVKTRFTSMYGTCGRRKPRVEMEAFSVALERNDLPDIKPRQGWFTLVALIWTM